MTMRDLRLRRGFTLEALGYLAGRDQSTVSRIERGLVDPTPETTVALARALGVSVSRLKAALPRQAPNEEVSGAA